MQLERRRKRSTFTGLSLHYWLASLATRTRAMAFVLADESGLLIASSLRGPEAEELAALAPVLHREQNDPFGTTKWQRLPVHITPIEIDGTPLLLCAVGIADRTSSVMDQAVEGVQRILAN